jgi:hypothetical protein
VPGLVGGRNERREREARRELALDQGGVLAAALQEVPASA